MHCEVPISFTQAALGDEIEVPDALEGPATLKFPKGPRRAPRFRLRGQGVPDAGVSGGATSTSRSRWSHRPASRRSQRELLREFARAGGDQIQQDRGFFDRVRDAFRKAE